MSTSSSAILPSNDLPHNSVGKGFIKTLPYFVLVAIAVTGLVLAAIALSKNSEQGPKGNDGTPGKDAPVGPLGGLDTKLLLEFNIPGSTNNDITFEFTSDVIPYYITSAVISLKKEGPENYGPLSHISYTGGNAFAPFGSYDFLLTNKPNEDPVCTRIWYPGNGYPGNESLTYRDLEFKNDIPMGPESYNTKGGLNAYMLGTYRSVDPTQSNYGITGFHASNYFSRKKTNHAWVSNIELASVDKGTQIKFTVRQIENQDFVLGENVGGLVYVFEYEPLAVPP